jgi:transposase InsO family protein
VGTPAKIYTAGEKAAALRAFAASGKGMRAWCAARGMSTATLCAWRRAYTKGGVAALEPKPRRPRRKARAPARTYTPAERRAALDAYRKSGMTQMAFARLWGISATTLGRWLRAHREHGPKGLESPWGGARRGRKKEPVPDAVRAEIVATRRRFPAWGLRRIKDSLARFAGLRVGVHKVREVVREEGLTTPPPKKKIRRAPPRVRRFERSKPRELWQSDITSYVLTRHSQRVYLTVFLDDYSRYVVAWSLALQQRSELVCECLLEGLARFGKPVEVLTDQGRQYFAWRGKSRFQKLLIREGIEHVVSRAHHPQTLGKCERLWKTVGDELWYRARPQDLDEARRRLGHFFDHYNHFRSSVRRSRRVRRSKPAWTRTPSSSLWATPRGVRSSSTDRSTGSH